MLFYSTNRNLPHGFKDKISFTTALLAGQVPDEGLFMPETIPQLSENQIKELRNQPYHIVATEVLKPFLTPEIPAETLAELCKQAYTFSPKLQPPPSPPLKGGEFGMTDNNEPLLLSNPNSHPLGGAGGGIFIARMDTGPTASFKDYAAQLMARLMNLLKPDNQTITILVATSGDTGSAIGEAFRGLDGIRVIILYPKNEVSTIQRKQLTTVGGNVTALEIDGKFDDCQRFVKMAFTDPDLQKLNLTSANSINIGRLLPQVVYYFYIYLQVAQDFEAIDFCIPTGNLGNAMGCEIARRMGLPIRKIIVATNANHAIPEWLKTGTYQKVEPSQNCISNAMNVGNPSNLARLFDLYGGTVDKNGTVHRQPDLEKIREHLEGVEISDEDTIACVKDFYEKHHILIEPHGAVGILAVKPPPPPKGELNNSQFINSLSDESIEAPAKAGLGAVVVLETAHPAKFPEVFEKELGFSPEKPESLKKIMELEEKKIELSADYEAFKKWILESGS